jgi:hypothetical protein
MVRSGRRAALLWSHSDATREDTWSEHSQYSAAPSTCPNERSRVNPSGWSAGSRFFRIKPSVRERATRTLRSATTAAGGHSPALPLQQLSSNPPAPSTSPTNAVARAGDNNAEATASSIPAPSSSNGAGHSPASTGARLCEPQPSAQPKCLTNHGSAAGHSPALPSLCACGRWKESAGHIVCKRCWFETPLEIRSLVHHAAPKHRRTAMRVILEAALARKTLAELFT